jgi:phytoene synthase
MTTVAIPEQARASGSSFYAGMRMLPQRERDAMYAVYAFCREVDDIADDLIGSRDDRARALDGWRADIANLFAGGDPGRAGYLCAAVADFGLAQADFEAVIDGMTMDVDRDICWPSAAELDLYCDRVASAVGRLSVRVFGMDEAPGLALSHHLGRALQLTNILRDIDEDAAIGRVYLAREAIEGAGIATGDIARVVGDPRLDQACRTIAGQARGHFAEADRILAARPRGHLIAPRLMEAVYAQLLRRMLKVGWAPPRRRVRHNKLAVLLTILRLRWTS